jgi:hypothetical protein
MRSLASRPLLLAALLALAAPAYARGGKGIPRGADTMEVGDAAFAVPLSSLDGKRTVDVLDSDGRPVVLLFGSYT